MKRRDFMKMMGGVFLLPLVPSVSFANAPKDLKAWFEENFVCHTGTPTTHLTIADGPAKISYPYKTFAIGVLNGDPEEAKLRTTQYFVDLFKPLANNKPDLWWRVQPNFESLEIVTYGKTWMTAEEIEDGGIRDGKYYQFIAKDKPRSAGLFLRDRWIEVSKPDNVELDFETNALRYVESKDILHKMRFRLVIPSHLQELAAIAHQEGAHIGKI